MPRKQAASLFAKQLYSPFLALRSNAIKTPMDIETTIKRKVSESKSPFLIISVAGLNNNSELLKKAKEVSQELRAQTSKQIFLMDKDYPEMKAKAELWLNKKLPKRPIENARKGAHSMLRWARLSPENQGKYLRQMSAFLNGPGMLNINKKIGYDYYISKLEKYLKEKPGEPPSKVKTYLRKIIKSKYFYWIVLYKIVGFFVKIGLFVYFFFLRKGDGKDAVKGGKLVEIGSAFNK